MKPIRLTISGLHSFREPQTVNFQELSGAGVFGIFGPTGSGKSSILDAMTLALYGTVGRAEHNTRGIINHSEKSLAVSFEFALGAVHERHRFKIERSYKRKDELAVQNVRSRIIRVVGDVEEVVADKDGDVTAFVKELLGLTPEDFTRAVVLPQGKFAEFLLLKGADRNRMLQRLFHMEQYGDALAQRLRSRMEARERDLLVVSEQMSALGDASESAIETAVLRVHEAVNEEKHAKLTWERQQSRHAEASRVWNLQITLRDIDGALTLAREKEATIADLARSLDRDGRANRVLPVLRVYREAKVELSRAEEKEKLAGQKLEGVTTRFAEVRTARELFRETYETRERLLSERKVVLTSALSIQAQYREGVQNYKATAERITSVSRELESLQKAFEQARERLEATERQIASHEEELKQLSVAGDVREILSRASLCLGEWERTREDLVKAQQECDRRRQAALNAEQEVVKSKQLRDALRLECEKTEEELRALQERAPLYMEDTNLRRSYLERAQHRLEQVEKQSSVLKQQRESATKLQLECDAKKHAVSELTAAQVLLQSQLESGRAQLLLLDANRKNWYAAELASQLQDGAPCPVCGSLHHPQQRALDELSAVETEKDSLREEISNLETTEKDLASRLQGAQIELAQAQAEISLALKSVESREEEIADGLKEASDLLASEYQGVIEATAMGAWVALQLQALTDASREFDLWNEHVKVQKEHEQTLLRSLMELEGNLRIAEGQFESATTELERALSQSLVVEQTLIRVEGNLRGLAGKLSLVEDSEMDAFATAALIRQKMQEIKSMDELWETRSAELSKFGQERLKYRSQYETMREDIHRKSLELKEYETSGRQLKAELLEKKTYLESLTEGRPLADVISEIELELGNQQIRSRELEQSYEETSLVFAESREEMAAWSATHTRQLGVFRKAEDELTGIMGREQFMSAEEVDEALLSDEERQQFGQLIQQHRDTIFRLTTRREGILDQMGGLGLTLSEEEWAQSEAALLEASENWKNAVGRREVAVKLRTDVEERHNRWKELDVVRAELSQEVLHMNQLKQMLSGNKFVEFMAQEQLEFVASAASFRLKELTHGRYALEVGPDGRFIMRDDHNGGVRRPVTSLSGGETFLTSLALALSLSTQIQLRGKHPLEFFFLDEGFGTLDADLLDVVMSTLEKLHMESMTIGIISHVPELQARLQRRLIVEPAEAAGHGSKVRLELA